MKIMEILKNYHKDQDTSHLTFLRALGIDVPTYWIGSKYYNKNRILLLVVYKNKTTISGILKRKIA